ncbi:MAG: hypothetical protein A2W03_02305 [Candidatus Aminicenantes bacterium RBG_16_63_16]|nr:MAG: hypothetical protein A2W03_02305 [Candidatus Aminicenantes bacterium RBG_16_63_16]
MALFCVSVLLSPVLGADKSGDFQRIGYYVFIGTGDYKPEYGPETPSFTLADWENLIDYLKSRGATTFIPLVTGHKLPYPSRAFPKHVETEAQSVRDDSLQRIIDYAKKSRLEVILAFTTTGHCRSYAQDHPELCIVNEDGSPAPGLCPNRPGSEVYPLGVVEEVLKRYKNLDGLLIHPPEIKPICFCPECRTLYKQKTGQDYAGASPLDRQRFFVETYLKFAAKLLAKAQKQASLNVKLMFNCDWMDDHVDLMSSLPADLDIIYWDYNLKDDYLAGRLQENLKRYQTMKRTIWYMPSSEPRFWTPSDADPIWGCGQAVKQIKIAGDNGIKNIGFFLGACIRKANIDRIHSGMTR